ncbi:MAG: hypothetical protein H0U69_15620 [Trueperaceae bacterium]|nr:hypothetical protein [Trueperaceae bacterium]
MFVRKTFVPVGDAESRAVFEEALARNEALELEEGRCFVTEIVAAAESGAWVYLERPDTTGESGDEPLSFRLPV